MTRTTTRPLALRLESELSRCGDLDGIAAAVLAQVGRDVPFAFGCLASIDPVSGLVTRPYKSHPLPMGDEDFAAAEYGAPDVNQFDEIVRRPIPVGALTLDTGGQPMQCRRFREFMAPVFGFTDELRAAFRARDVTWAVLAVYRGPDEPAFTAAEASVLATASEVVAHAVRRVLFADAEPGPPQAAAVVVVDGRDRVTERTAAVEDSVAELGGWDNGSLPANALAVTCRARSTGQPATARVLGRSGSWLSLKAFALDGDAANRSVVLTIDSAPAAAIGELRLAAHGLTQREQDVVRLVVQGASTKAIATTLFLSPHTVQDHLKAVFAKLSVSSRRELAARLR